MIILVLTKDNWIKNLSYWILRDNLSIHDPGGNISLSISGLTAFENTSNGIRFIIIIKHNMRQLVASEFCQVYLMELRTFNQVLELALPPVKSASHLVSGIHYPSTSCLIANVIGLENAQIVQENFSHYFGLLFFLITSSHLSFVQQRRKKRRKREKKEAWRKNAWKKEEQL